MSDLAKSSKIIPTIIMSCHRPLTPQVTDESHHNYILPIRILKNQYTHNFIDFITINLQLFLPSSPSNPLVLQLNHPVSIIMYDTSIILLK